KIFYRLMKNLENNSTNPPALWRVRSALSELPFALNRILFIAEHNKRQSNAATDQLQKLRVKGEILLWNAGITTSADSFLQASASSSGYGCFTSVLRNGSSWDLKPLSAL